MGICEGGTASALGQLGIVDGLEEGRRSRGLIRPFGGYFDSEGAFSGGHFRELNRRPEQNININFFTV